MAESTSLLVEAYMRLKLTGRAGRRSRSADPHLWKWAHWRMWGQAWCHAFWARRWSRNCSTIPSVHVSDCFGSRVTLYGVTIHLTQWSLSSLWQDLRVLLQENDTVACNILILPACRWKTDSACMVQIWHFVFSMSESEYLSKTASRQMLQSIQWNATCTP